MAAHRLSGPARQVMLVAATAAPSLHNSQPWRFIVSGAQIDLYADPGRQLREVDPTGRQLLISCGAALFNLRLAAGHLGLEPKVRVLPDPTQPTLVARATISGHRMAPGAVRAAVPGHPATGTPTGTRSRTCASPRRPCWR